MTASTPSRMATSASLIWALTWRRFAPQNRRDGLRLVWVFLEPVGQIAVLMVIFSLIGRAPAYGDSFALFLLTGIAVLNLFTSTSQSVAGAIQGLNSAGRLPPVGMFHEAIARVLFALIIVAIYLPALMIGIRIVERVDVGPHHLPPILGALLLTALMAFGVGLLRGYATIFASAIERVYVILSRALLFISGVFFAPSFMPPQIRELLVWNPILHAVELLRLGVYAEYPTIVYDGRFLTWFALASTALGMTLVWRRRAAIMG